MGRRSKRRSRPAFNRRLTCSPAVDAMRADYEEQLDARYAAARGFVDAIVYPEDTRDLLALALRAALHRTPDRTSARSCCLPCRCSGA